MSDVLRNAHTVLFPVLLDTILDDTLRRFLDSGGVSLLFGETADEYSSGCMSAQRRQDETADLWIKTIGDGSARAGGKLITAHDADISAVHRLQPRLERSECSRSGRRKLSFATICRLPWREGGNCRPDTTNGRTQQEAR